MTTCKYCPHPGQPHRTDHERNWAIWRDYRTTSATLRDVGRAHGIDPERVRQIVLKADRAVINALTRAPDAPVPASDAEREGMLGVEFVFTRDVHSRHREAGWTPLADVTGRNRIGRRTHSHRYAIDEGIIFHVKKND